MKLPSLPRDSIRADTAVLLLNSLAFILMMGATLLLLIWNLNQFVLSEAEKKAQILLNHNLAVHAYLNRALKPAVFALDGASEDPAYFDPTWMSSTYAVREIDKIFRGYDDFNDYYYKEVAINARSPQNEADAYERQVLIEMAANPKDTTRTAIRLLNGRLYYTTMLRGEVMESGCLRCHSNPNLAPAGLTARYGAERSFNREDGELVSVVSVRVPLGVALAEGVHLLVGWSGVLILAFAILFFWLLTIQRRLIRKPLEMIRNTALQISTDSQALGQQIALPFGKELVELATAFNRMSSGLRRHQDELEDLVAERTRELGENRKLIDGILDTTPNLILLTDRQTNQVIYRNREFDRFFNAADVESITVETTLAVLHPEDEAIYHAHRLRLETTAGEMVESVIRFRNGAGEWRWMNIRSVVYTQAKDGTPLQLLHICDDITDAHEAEKQLEFMGTHDYLTGLSNRGHFETSAEKIWQDGQSLASVLMIDVDNLKLVNDHLGHAQGDRLLRHVARALKTAVREEDIVARVGGDEFAVLLTGANETEAAVIKDRIQSLFAGEISTWEVKGLGLSVGLSTVEPRISLVDAMRKADERMYRDKNRRKRRKTDQ